MPFSKSIRNKTWNNLKEIEGQNPSIWRVDRKNELVNKASYGDINSKYGWNIHHKDQNTKNNNISNLEAIHIETHKKLHR